MDFNPDEYLAANFDPDKYLGIQEPQKSFGQKITSGINDFGAGAMEGATFDTNTINKQGSFARVPRQPEAIPGSIMREDGSAKPKPTDSFAGIKGAGRAAGSLIPMAVAEIMAGATAPALVLKFGMSAVQAAMAQVGMTMASYEGLRGAAQQNNPMETAGSMATGFAAGMPLGAAGYGVSKGFEKLMRGGSEGLADQYLYTPPRINKSLEDKGKPSLGRKMLNETPYGGSMSKNEVYNDNKLRLENNRMLVQNKLQNADEAAMTPHTPDVPAEGSTQVDMAKWHQDGRGNVLPGSGPAQLEYKPGTTQIVDPDKGTPWPGMIDRQPTSGYAHWPGIRKNTDPVLSVLPKAPHQETFDEYGTWYQSDPASPRLGHGIHFGGTPTGTEGITPASGMSSENAAQKWLFKNRPQGVPFNAGGIKRGGIDLDEVRAEGAPLLREQANIAKTEAVGAIDNIMGNLARGKKHATYNEAFQLLTDLDAEVNKAYETVDKNTIPHGTEARAAMANKLRDMLRQALPGAAELLGENHTRNMIDQSLMPQMAGGPLVKQGGNTFKSAVAKTVGTRAGLGLARGMDATITPGTIPNKVIERGIKPAAQKASQIGLAEYMERKSKKKEQHNGK